MECSCYFCSYSAQYCTGTSEESLRSKLCLPESGGLKWGSRWRLRPGCRWNCSMSWSSFHLFGSIFAPLLAENKSAEFPRQRRHNKNDRIPAVAGDAAFIWCGIVRWLSNVVPGWQTCPAKGHRVLVYCSCIRDVRLPCSSFAHLLSFPQRVWRNSTFHTFSSIFLPRSGPLSLKGLCVDNWGWLTQSHRDSPWNCQADISHLNMSLVFMLPKKHHRAVFVSLFQYKNYTENKLWTRFQLC